MHAKEELGLCVNPSKLGHQWATKLGKEACKESSDQPPKTCKKKTVYCSSEPKKH